MFRRILITSSLTIITTVICLIVLITNYYSDAILQGEQDLNVRTMERVEDYFLNKQNDWNGFIRDLYIKEDLIEDLTTALNHEYEDYMRLRLDNYAKQPSFTPNDSFTYINAFFAQDEDVNAAILHSSNYTDVFYEFIYSYSRWEDSLNGLNLYEMEGRIDSTHLENTFTESLLINNPATLEKMGYVTIYYSTDAIDRILYTEDRVVKSSFFLLDKDHHVVYSNDDGVAKEFVEKLKKNEDNDTVGRENKKYIVHAMNDINGYTAYTVIPRKELKKLTFVQGTMWILITLTLIISLVLTYIIIRNYSARIERIDKTIRTVQEGDLSVRIPISAHDDELTTIASSFNSMLEDINEYIEQVYVLGLKQQEAELKVLQSQINPHFLFNTLETIRMTAVIDGSKASSEMIYHLSRLLRYSLNSNESVPIYAEIENARQYLQLIQLQHPDKLSMQIDVSKEVEGNLIQRLVLQPIVENYVIHGFQKERRDNHLSIQSVIDDGDIQVIISDNGNGIEAARLQEIKDHIEHEQLDKIDSIGMKNVHQRLKLKYGDKYGLQIESEKNKGTTITLKIPLGGD